MSPRDSLAWGALFVMFMNVKKRRSAAGRSDLADHAWILRDDLVRNFPAMYFNITWKVQCQPNSITLHGGNAHNPYGVAWVTNHYLFTFSSRNNQHRKDLLPSRGGCCTQGGMPWSTILQGTRQWAFPQPLGHAREKGASRANGLSDK